MKPILAILGCLIAFQPLTAFDIADELNQEVKRRNHVPQEAWSIVEPYLIPENHPVKAKLDKIFKKSRAIRSLKSLDKAGFVNRFPPSHSKAVVIRHRDIPGYIFKIYTDDRLTYYRNEPEYVTWMLRARGARLIRNEIKKQGWGAYFKAPKKWIYALPPKPEADKKHLQKNFILVENEMDLLGNDAILKKWRDGTITTQHLDMLFHLVNATGLRGGCKYDNIPICKDGRLAFIDTQNNLRWPLPYERLYGVLPPNLKAHWEALVDSVGGYYVPEQQ